MNLVENLNSFNTLAATVDPVSIMIGVGTFLVAVTILGALSGIPAALRAVNANANKPTDYDVNNLGQGGHFIRGTYTNRGVSK